MSLRFEHVSKTFGTVPAVDDLSIDVAQGALFGFLGPAGAGKTTAMRMILDLLRPDAGQITWNGQPVRSSPRHLWGYLPEARGLYPGMEVAEQLIFLARLNGLSKAHAARAVDVWLERFQLNAVRKMKVEELSQDSLQKVHFLAAVVHDPDVLVLDEPFSGLDPGTAAAFKDAWLESHRRGKTILLATQQLDQVDGLVDDIVMVNQGRLVLEGSAHAIKRQYGRGLARLRLDRDPEAAWLDAMKGVTVALRRPDYIEVALEAGFDTNDLADAALWHGGVLSYFELVEPSLAAIFNEQAGAPQTTTLGAPAPAAPVHGVSPQ